MRLTPLLLLLTGCASRLPVGNLPDAPSPHAAGGSLTQAAAAAGVFQMLTWAGLALIVAGIVAWMLGNRTRALLMIATGACVSVVTLLALEVASLLMWPAVLIALIVSVTVLARWALPIWKRLRS